jgi:hypothetical protein
MMCERFFKYYINTTHKLHSSYVSMHSWAQYKRNTEGNGGVMASQIKWPTVTMVHIKEVNYRRNAVFILK